VPKKQFKPPEHLVSQWPEVFEDLHIDTMPVAYMNIIRLTFEDGRIWEIDVGKQLQSNDPEAVADSLIDMLEEYAPTIVDMDFDIDVQRLKQDIEKETKNLL
jgi:hypothetical protein